MRLQAWLVLESFPRTAKTGVFCICSFTVWWMSTHRAPARGLMIRGHLAQVTEPMTASGSHHATATRTCQVLESSNENADFPEPTLLGFVHIPVGLWSRSASLCCSAPPAAAMETGSSTCSSRADSSGGWAVSARIWEALQENVRSVGDLGFTRQELNRYRAAEQGHPPTAPIIPKEKLEMAQRATSTFLPSQSSPQQEASELSGGAQLIWPQGGVTCHSEGRFVQRI